MNEGAAISSVDTPEAVYLKQVLSELHEKSLISLNESGETIQSPVTKTENFCSAIPNQFITVIEVKEHQLDKTNNSIIAKKQNCEPLDDNKLDSVTNEKEKNSKKKYENIKIETKVFRNTRDVSSKIFSSSSFVSGSSNVMLLAENINSENIEVRKKIPPRPPPKLIKRTIPDIPNTAFTKPSLQDPSESQGNQNLRHSEPKLQKPTDPVEETELDNHMVKRSSEEINKQGLQRSSCNSTPTSSFSKASSNSSLQRNKTIKSISNNDSKDSFDSADLLSDRVSLIYLILKFILGHSK